jgi:hypothetical protein
VLTVCALFYGDYPELARRCLGSILDTADWGLVRELRLGLNAVADATLSYVQERCRDVPVPCLVMQPCGNANAHKYPLMRRLFHDTPLRTSHVMWFDDDSYVTGGPGWWSQVAQRAEQCDLLGSVYRLARSLPASVRQAIMSQPWYGGKPLPPDHRPVFCTGGWWVVRAAILQRWDWPVRALDHNGGDWLLGELCRQQGYRQHHFRDGVAINYDAARGGESRAVRRGVTTPWPWEEGSGPVAGQQHDFQVTVSVLGAAGGMGGQ